MFDLLWKVVERSNNMAVIACVLVIDRYRYRADICHIGRQSVSVVLYIFTDCVKPIVEKSHAV